jgi:hypothetical protein
MRKFILSLFFQYWISNRNFKSVADIRLWHSLLCNIRGYATFASGIRCFAHSWHRHIRLWHSLLCNIRASHIRGIATFAFGIRASHIRGSATFASGIRCSATFVLLTLLPLQKIRTCAQNSSPETGK